MSDDELLNLHLNLVLEANEVVNLTRITSEREGRLLHIEDSLTGLEEMNSSLEGLYGDMGTGGGYPGIPLAIKTGRETVLIDSVRKKTTILDNIIAQLGLGHQITTYNGRIEDLALERRSQFSVLTARALSQLVSLAELAAPLLKMNGSLICYKANMSEVELHNAKSLKDKLGMDIESIRDFTLSDGETKRCIVKFKKFKEAEISLPRRVGLAQKKPLES